MTDAVVTRLYRCLVEAILELRPEADRQPVTVAEIYQDLVPYRAVRDALGIGLNADYEHALLRLLAGVGGFVRIEPDEAQAELRDELESPDPNVALFRKFAACDVRVRLPDRNGAPASPATAAGRASPPPSTRPAKPDPSPPSGGAEPRDVRSPDGGEACASCGESLPSDRPVLYCPFCGGDRRSRPCPSCGEPMEPRWRYCIACGAAAAS